MDNTIQTDMGHDARNGRHPPGMLKRPAFIFFGLVAGLILAASPMGSQVNRWVYDGQVGLQPPAPISDRIIIVAIDEPSFQALSTQWPWPRSVHARLVDALHTAGAKTIAFDILFSEPSPAPEEDEQFSRSMMSHGNVVLASGMEILDSNTHTSILEIPPIQRFQQAASGIGVDTMPLDPDGLLRRYFLTHHGRNNLGYTAARAHALRAEGNRINKLATPSSTALIRFHGPSGSFPTVHYYQALDPARYFKDAFFKDALILVGFNTRSSADPTTRQPDHYPTPHVRFGDKHMAGVEIQANIAAGFLSGRFIKKSTAALVAGMAALFFSLSLSFFFLPLSGAALAFVLASGAALGLDTMLFQAYDLWLEPAWILIPTTMLYLSSLIYTYQRVTREKALMRTLFSKYLGPAFIDHMLTEDSTDLLARPVDATVLFLDIKNFSELTRTLNHQELIDLLSRYLGAFSDIIIRSSGHIDKIIGDGIMAVWGIPRALPDHAALACRTALDIEQQLQVYQKEDAQQHFPKVDIRIGINSGMMQAGDIGGRTFKDFTVHGSEVNLGKRIEPLNKKFGTRILISQHTQSRIKNIFSTRRIDTLPIKGYIQPVTVFELMQKPLDPP
ncbi:MAG: adenylate/guanylate cyclase domain-containing protein [Desulfobacteraceae bacterium]|nr:MAG: adenylate/guanylate cyclase domain-containing protein [Desulfobacteraceae bacterium]